MDIKLRGKRISTVLDDETEIIMTSEELISQLDSGNLIRLYSLLDSAMEQTFPNGIPQPKQELTHLTKAQCKKMIQDVKDLKPEKKPIDYIINKIKELLAQGKTRLAISSQLGLKLSFIQSIIDRNKLELPKQEFCECEKPDTRMVHDCIGSELYKCFKCWKIVNPLPPKVEKIERLCFDQQEGEKLEHSNIELAQKINEIIDKLNEYYIFPNKR